MKGLVKFTNIKELEEAIKSLSHIVQGYVDSGGDTELVNNVGCVFNTLRNLEIRTIENLELEQEYLVNNMRVKCYAIQHDCAYFEYLDEKDICLASHSFYVEDSDIVEGYYHIFLKV